MLSSPKHPFSSVHCIICTRRNARANGQEDGTRTLGGHSMRLDRVVEGREPETRERQEKLLYSYVKLAVSN